MKLISITSLPETTELNGTEVLLGDQNDLTRGIPLSQIIAAVSVSASDVPIATTTIAGRVKPDGSTVFVTSDGTISLNTYNLVPKTTTINSKPLTGNISLSATDIGLGNVANVNTTNPANITQSANYRFVSDTEKTTWNNKQSALGFVPVSNTTTINNHPLSGNVTLAASDVGLGNVQNVDTTNAGNITSGTLSASRLPVASTTSLGVVKVDGSTITINNGVISSIVSSGGIVDTSSFVNKTLTINNKPLSGNIILFSSDISGLGTAAIKDVPVSGNASNSQVVLGNDGRLSDARTPLSHPTSAHSDWPSSVSMTEVGYLDGLTSNIQTQLSNKLNLDVSDINVINYGAKGDGKSLKDGIANATTTFTSASAAFTSSDTGKMIIIFGVGPSGTNLKTTITYVNATTITLGTATSSSVSGVEFVYGTDDTTAFQNIADNVLTRSNAYSPNWEQWYTHKKTRIQIPSNKIFIIGGSVNINLKDNFEWYGGGTIVFYNTVAFNVSGATRGDFTNINFDGLQSNDSTTNSVAIKYQVSGTVWTKQCAIKDCRIYRVKNGILAPLNGGTQPGYELTVKDNRIETYNVTGSVGVDVGISDSIITGNIVNGFDENFHIRWGGAIFTQNHPWGGTGGTYKSNYGLVIDAADVLVSNNIFDQASIANINITSSALNDRNNIVITGNDFYRLSGDNNKFIILSASSANTVLNYVNISNNTGVAVGTYASTAALVFNNITLYSGNAVIGPNTWNGPPNDDWPRPATSVKISTDLTSNSDTAIPSVKAVKTALSTVSSSNTSILSVKDSPFNAVGNGTTDDTAAIQSAITSAGVNGGIVLLPPGKYKITSTLVMPQNVILRGSGYSLQDDYLIKAATSITVGAIINGPVISIGDGTKQWFGNGIEDIAILLNDKATIGILWNAAVGGFYKNIFVLGNNGGTAPTLVNTAYLLTTTNSSIANTNTMQNTFINVKAGMVNTIFKFGYTTGSNVCHNSFINIGGSYYTDGMYLEGADNNNYSMIFLFARPGATGYGVRLIHGEAYDSHYFYQMQAGSGMYVGPNASGIVFGYDKTNGQPDPILADSTSRLSWTSDSPNSNGWHISGDINVLPEAIFTDGSISKTLSQLAASVVSDITWGTF